MSRGPGRRVAVVTGGAGGIGLAAASRLARNGYSVVLMDPAVTVTGEALPPDAAAAALHDAEAQIRSVGGEVIASTASVTQPQEVAELFDDVVARWGSLDVVINAAGISRRAGLLDSTEQDWRSILGVHVDGYLNVLLAALPIMAEAGSGRIVGITSGVGLQRTAPDSPAYSTAKRAVAAMTWRLGRYAPSGVTVNALSPIAATRMVAFVLASVGASPRPDGGVDLTGVPPAEHMAPALEYLCAPASGWLTGSILFSAGSELSIIRPPDLLEAIRTNDVDFAAALNTLVPVILTSALTQQNTTGGSNPRFAEVYDPPPRQSPLHPPPPRDSRPGSTAPTATCVVVGPPGDMTDALKAALGHWSTSMIRLDPAPADGSDVFAMCAARWAAAVQMAHPAVTAAIVIAPAPSASSRLDSEASSAPRWSQLLAGHRHLTSDLLLHAAWLRAVAGLAQPRGHRLRVIHVCAQDLDGPGGDTLSQALAQMARSVNDAAQDLVSAFSLGVAPGHGNERALADLLARLVAAHDTDQLAGAELVWDAGWLSISRHPRPAFSVSVGGPDLPPWFDACLRRSAHLAFADSAE